MQYVPQSPPYMTGNHDYNRHSYSQYGYPQINERMSFLPPEMPGEVPRPKTDPTSDIEGAGTPVPVQTYTEPPVDEIRHDYAGMGRDRVVSA